MNLSKETLELIRNYENWVSHHDNCLYRGLSDERHEIKSSLHVAQPKEVDYEKDKININLKNIYNAKRLNEYEKFSKETDIQFLTKLQHYGQKTPLIDFTKCPYTALWFACCPYNKSTDAKVVCVKGDKYESLPAEKYYETIDSLLFKDKLYMWDCTDQFKRSASQRAVLLFGEDPIKCFEQFDNEIPVAIKQEIMLWLMKHKDIHYITIYPDMGIPLLPSDRGIIYGTNIENTPQIFETEVALSSLEKIGALGIALKELYFRADEFKNLGKNHFKHAVKIYDRILSYGGIKNTAFSAHCYNEKACCLTQMAGENEDSDEIIFNFERSVEIVPQNSLFHKNYILALSKSNALNKSRAIAHIDKWSQYFEHDIVFNYNVAVIYGEIYDNDTKKLAYIKKCERNRPTKDKKYMSIIYTDIADYYHNKLGITAKNTIEEYHNKAIMMDKTNIAPHLKKAFINYGRKSINYTIAGLRNNINNFEGMYMLHVYLCNIKKFKFAHNVAIAIKERYPDFKIIDFCVVITNYFRLLAHRRKNPHPNFDIEQECKNNIDTYGDQYKNEYNLMNQLGLRYVQEGGDLNMHYQASAFFHNLCNAAQNNNPAEFEKYNITPETYYYIVKSQLGTYSIDGGLPSPGTGRGSPVKNSRER